MIGPDGVLALINLTRICAGLTLLDLREQKAHFSDNYFDIFESNIIEVIGMTVCIYNFDITYSIVNCILIRESVFSWD